MMHTPAEPELATVPAPTGEALVSFLRASAHEWSGITGAVDPDALIMFGLYVVVSLTGGLTFNTISIALPKIVDERLGADVPLL